MKPILFSTPMVQAILDGRKTQTRRVIKIDDAPENWRKSLAGSRYKPSDILWVRETWADVFGKYEYRADYSESENTYRVKRYGTTIAKWRPAIFMPRAAARIFLRVTDVRVERLQDITEDDATAEGLRIGIGGAPCFSCRDAFAELWDKLNAKRGYGWDTNPWVWVIEFERCEKPDDICSTDGEVSR